jgi:cephalosporin hydroxylase
MVFLDSNHTHDHALKELELYSPLVSKESYLVAFNTIVEDLPPNDPPSIVADVTRLHSTGWRPNYDLKTGLQHTIEW